MIIDRNENKEVIALLGAGGMGVAIIKKFAAGKKILLGDISQAKLDEVAKDFTYLGYDVECMIVDGCSKEAVEAFASRAATVAIAAPLIPNAGILPNPNINIGSKTNSDTRY